MGLMMGGTVVVVLGTPEDVLANVDGSAAKKHVACAATSLNLRPLTHALTVIASAGFWVSNGAISSISQLCNRARDHIALVVYGL